MSLGRAPRRTPAMALPPVSQPMLFLVLTVALMASIWVKPIRASSPEAGTVIPAESRPCVDCHAFEFMQRALQDLRKTAFNLDSRTETLLLGVEKRALCDCLPTNALS